MTFFFRAGISAGMVSCRTVPLGGFRCRLTGSFFMANGIYLTNEYQDYESDRRNSERIGGPNRGMGMDTTGGTRVLVRGILEKRHVLIIGILFFLLTIPLGLIIQFGFHTGWATIPLGILGLFLPTGILTLPSRRPIAGWESYS